MTCGRAFFWGQLSAAVEPVAVVMGASLVCGDEERSGGCGDLPVCDVYQGALRDRSTAPVRRLGDSGEQEQEERDAHEASDASSDVIHVVLRGPR